MYTGHLKAVARALSLSSSEDDEEWVQFSLENREAASLANDADLNYPENWYDSSETDPVQIRVYDEEGGTRRVEAVYDGEVVVNEVAAEDLEGYR